MVLVETTHSVRVNQSMIRLDGDPWHSIQVPLQDDPAGDQATPPQQAQMVNHSGNEPLLRPGADHSLWIKQTSNQVDLLEAMVQEPLLSPHMSQQGFLVGVPSTLGAVHETTHWADLAYLTVGTDKTNMATAISMHLISISKEEGSSWRSLMTLSGRNAIGQGSTWKKRNPLEHP